MKNKHTPGPWAWSESETWEGIYIHQAEGAPYTTESSDIASINTVAIGIETSKANAHLIAAAPEMLEALKLAQNILMNAGQRPIKGNNLFIISEAIRKARGE